METAGTVQIQITGNLAPFEAALARAQQQAVAFDAKISAQLNGAGLSDGLARIATGVDTTNALLTKLTTSGAAASAALAKVGAATTATTEALGKVAVATKLVNAEMASIGASGGGAAVLSAGTVSAREFAAALEATGGNLSKITPQMVGLAVETEAVAAASKTAAVGMVELGIAEKEAAGLGAGVSREFSVLGGEVLRGNFSRIPGSLLVMNERLAATGSGVLTLANGMKALGSLGSVIFNPFVLGFLAITVGADLAVKAFKSIGGGVEDVNTILENHKKLIDEITGAYPEAAAAAKKYEEIAKQLPQSVVASDATARIEEDQKALDKSMGGIVNTLRLAQASADAVGSAGADAFGHLADEIEAGTLHASDLARNLVGLHIDPSLNDTAQSIAQDLIGASKEAIVLQNTLDADKGLKSIGPDGQKAQLTLFDVSAGFKDVNSAAGSADATIAKLFGTMNSGGSGGFGVTRSLAGQLGGQLQTTLGMFQQVDAAIQNSRQDQLAGMVQLEAQFRATTARVDELKKAISSAGGKDNIRDFFGDVSNIKNANAEIENATASVQKLFAAMATGNASVSSVAQGLDMVRQTLINDGFPVDKVDALINRLVQVNRELVADQGQVHQLGTALQALKDKTVTVTVVTQQVGTGTKSIYDVGTTGGIGVTRYGGDGSPSFSQQSYSVPSETGGGTAGVNVTRFATGGIIHPGDSQKVSFFKNPAETVGIFTPGQMDALANPQSAFTGTQATANDNRVWTVMMNIEANTRKSAQLLDEIKTSTASSSSSLGGSSYGGGSLSGASGDPLTAQYLQVLKQIRSNFAANGIVGGGSIGYGGQGLAATPQQIARTIVYGGQSSVGSASGYVNQHGGENYTSPTARAKLAAMSPSDPNYAAAYAGVYGFNSGGMIAPGDTQEVKFFKSPDEAVAIFTPQQLKAVQGANQNQPAVAHVDGRPIVVNQTHNWNGDAPPSKDSIAEMRRQTALAVREAMRSVNGR